MPSQRYCVLIVYEEVKVSIFIWRPRKSYLLDECGRSVVLKMQTLFKRYYTVPHV